MMLIHLHFLEWLFYEFNFWRLWERENSDVSCWNPCLLNTCSLLTDFSYDTRLLICDLVLSFGSITGVFFYDCCVILTWISLCFQDWKKQWRRMILIGAYGLVRLYSLCSTSKFLCTKFYSILFYFNLLYYVLINRFWFTFIYLPNLFKIYECFIDSCHFILFYYKSTHLELEQRIWWKYS